MPTESFEQLLDRAAAAFGIDSGFWDIWGKYQTAAPEVLQSILASMGVACSSAEELERSLEEHTRREWARLVPPSVVVSETSQRLPLRVPVELRGGLATLTIRCENGSTTEAGLELKKLEQAEALEVAGRSFVQLEAPLAAALPLGYHQIEVRLGTLSAETHYIVTPDRAWTYSDFGNGGRAAGITVSLYGVRSARNWGCGDFRDLLDVADWVAAGLHASFLGLNPLHAIHNRRPFNTSPYLPNCIYYQNFLYLDVEGIEDYGQCRRARELRGQPEIEAEIEQLRTAPFVEYERVAALKLRFLKLLFVRFLREWRAGSARAREFNEFLSREGELLERFATYAALDEYLHRRNPDVWVWTQWPDELRSPDSPAVRAFRAKHWRSVLFYQYLQWQIEIQLSRAQRHARKSGLGLGLYHDLALATDRFGSDLWGHRDFFVTGCRVGAPPDGFAPLGQDWGFPPPDSKHHRENGYRLFAESIRRNCRHGGALRMDHVMRLFRLYWIPDGLTAAQGAYVRETSLDFVRVLALESVRNRVMVVGEDLGTVESEVRETLAKFGILSYRLFYFERDEMGEFLSPEKYPIQALVSSTTHDLPTLAGFWLGADIEARRQSGLVDEAGYELQWEERAAHKQKMLDALFETGLLDPDLGRSASSYPELTGELYHAVVGFLALTPSQLLAINQEDLTKEIEQQNLPATTWQYPNWGRKMKFTVEQLRSDPEALGYTAMFREWIVKSGRAPQ